MSDPQPDYIIGPFTKETFNQAHWKYVTDKIYQLKPSNEEETIPDCKEILQFMKELNKHPDYNEYFGDPAIKNYFFREFFLSNARYLIMTKTFNNPLVLELSNAILQEMVLFWLKALHEDHPKLTETAKFIFDIERIYYKLNNQEEFQTNVVPSFANEASPEHIEWVKSLKVGDQIDCIKSDLSYKKMCWSHARVNDVSEAYIIVAFEHEKDKYNKVLSKTTNANEIAAYQSKCNDFPWRLSLKKGDELDVCDTSNVWYTSTVLDVRESQQGDRTIKEVQIGYRTYNEEGDKTDSKGQRFFGWSAKYDEWISVTNPRLRERGTMAKKLFLGSSNSDDPVIEDSNDKVYCEEGKKIYAITRSLHCKSTFFVGLVNLLGEAGGFDKILARISDTENWCPIEIVSLLVTLVGTLHAVLHRDFAFEYIPKLMQAVWRNLKMSPESNLRNFTKERIDSILQAFDSLLKRVYSLPEKNEAIESLSLEICLLCFDSKFLERKLQGLKTLLELMKKTKFGHTKFIETDDLRNFIEKNQIFDKIYGATGHTQLVQRSSEFLKFLINEDDLTIEELELVWGSTRKGDTETKLAIYKVLSEIAMNAKTAHLNFIMTKIAEIPPEDMIPEEIDLIYELHRFATKASGFTKKALDFYWNIIIDSSSQYSTELAAMTLNKFSDVLKGWDLKEERLEAIYHCIDNIEKGVAVLGSLKIMKKLIDQYPQSQTSMEVLTKRTCVEHLCTKKHLLTILMKDVKSFKDNIKAKVADIKNAKEEELNSLVPENASYITAVGERLEFILYIFGNNVTGSGSSTLTYEHLSELWDVMVNEAFLPGERDVVYKWIKETAESKSGSPLNSISNEDLLKFFQEKINNAQDYQSMTVEGFNCVKNLFLIINEKLEKISKTKSGTKVTAYQQSHNSYGVSYLSYSYNYEDTKEVNSDFEYQVNVLPEELEGIQSIWNFIFTASNEDVVEKAIDFLNKLYLHVKAELEEKLAEMRSQFLAICFKNLKEVYDKKDQMEASEFTSNCLRCLSLIRSIMDESEKKGIGQLKSHSGLVKGELISFNVINELSITSDVSRKVEIQLYSNTTVFDMRVEIGKQLKATWDQIKLTRGNKEIKDNENGKTLGDIRIKNGETLHVSKRPTPPIPQADLLMADGSFNPVAKEIFVSWYNTFAENGRMNAEGCANFIHSCTGDHCKGDDKRVKDVFATYDSDHDGFLTVENFLNFYYMACKQRPSVVWSNLAANHYRNDLKKITEIEAEKVDTTVLTRYLISQNADYFHLIFSLLDCGGTVANEAWKLLNRLPTSSEIFSNILELKGVRDAPVKNWNDLLDSGSVYKLLYTLHVLEYLMEDKSETEENSENFQYWVKDPKILEYQKNWRADFIAFEGFDHLFRIFELFSRKDHATLSLFEKNIISFLLKILKNYLTATFAATTSSIYRCMSFIKLLVPLDFISNYIKNSNENGNNTVEVAQPAATEVKKIEGSKGTEKSEKLIAKLLEKKKENLKIEETGEFKVLVEKLRGDLGNQILSKINFKDFITTIATLGFDILQKNGDFESEDRMILEYSISMLVAILLYNKPSIDYFLNINKSPENYQLADKFIIGGVFCSKSLIVRKFFSHALYVLCKFTTDYQDSLVSKHIINLFLQNLPSSEDESRKDCHQYFELLCKLIEETYQGGVTDGSFDFDALIGDVINRIKEHVSQEKRQSLYQSDRIFIGLLNLCDKLIQAKPALKDLAGSPTGFNLIHELIEVCLFSLDEKEVNFQDFIGDADINVFEKDYVKCKTKDSRAIAYKLLITLCKNHPANLDILLELFKKLILVMLKHNNTTKSWGYSPYSDTRATQGYAGIRNLGCICYMNAMLQQFFMTPAFRYAILAADDKKEPNLVNKDNKWMVDDNVLHQLQNMFGFLELTDRRDYNPHEFCFAFKDFSGRPVNVSEQQDTQEFLNTIFERLENGLKQTPFRQILEGVYGGKTSNQIICHGCRNVKEREEPFYNLSVEVKNMKTVYDSIEQFITGETIEDYNCESCQQKNSITKRTCLSYLPNVLIVHLKRIVFDLDTLMNQKINSRLEFPGEIDMEPYTAEGLAWREKNKAKEAKKKQKMKAGESKDEEGDDQKKEELSPDVEGLEKAESPEKEEKVEEEDTVEGPYQLHPKEYYQYRLAGVVVHIGTAEVGHYYSYININRGKSEHNPSEDKWLEFNDSTIKDFDLKNLEKECFGGASGDSSDDYWGGWSKGGRENSKNAYILVYERVKKDPLKFVVDNKEDESYLNKVLNIERVLSEKPEAVKIEKEEIEDKETKEKRIRETYSCEYHMLKRFIPSGIYKKVWEDNHKFMFEKHMYNDDFFKFIKEICNSITFPDVKNGCVNHIYPGHADLPNEQKESISTLLNFLCPLIFFVLSKSDDHNAIVDLSNLLMNLISLCPKLASHVFDQIVCKNLAHVLDLFINCPDKHVRTCTTQIVLHCINVMISFYGFSLNIERLKEKGAKITELSPDELRLCTIESTIVEFLQTLLNFLHTEVAKNWTKFTQYFEFWRDFSLGGEAQMAYMFSHEMIALFGDFYLERQSPIQGNFEKKHSMGNKYADPDFNPLIQIIANILQRTQIMTQTGNVPYSSLGRQGLTLYQISDNDWKILTHRGFYEKTMKGKYNPQALGIIIQQFSFENETFSYHLLQIILRGISNSGFEDCKAYLEALIHFLNIIDYLQLKRIEWALGFPQPTVTASLKGPDSYGLYGNASLEDAVISYESPNVDKSITLLNYIFHSRKKFDNLVLLCLKYLLVAATTNQAVFDYLLYLPPPSTYYAKFTDLFRPFLEYYANECKRFQYTSFPKEELAQEVRSLMQVLETKIEAKVEETRGTQAGGEPRVLSSLNPVYIVGKTIKEEVTNTMLLGPADSPDIIYLENVEVTCYYTESKPTGKDNLAFPRGVIQDGKLLGEKVQPDTPVANFIKPRTANNLFATDQTRAFENKDGAEDAKEQEDKRGQEPLFVKKFGNLATNAEAGIWNNYFTPDGDLAKSNNSIGSDKVGSYKSIKDDDIYEQLKENLMDEESRTYKENKATDENTHEIVTEKPAAAAEDLEEVSGEMNVKETAMFTRFVLYNNSTFDINCQLAIYVPSNEFNFRIPASVFYLNLKPKTKSVVLTLTKTVPELPWGEFEVKCQAHLTENAIPSPPKQDKEEVKRMNFQISEGSFLPADVLYRDDFCLSGESDSDLHDMI